MSFFRDINDGANLFIILFFGALLALVIGFGYGMIKLIEYLF